MPPLRASGHAMANADTRPVEDVGRDAACRGEIERSRLRRDQHERCTLRLHVLAREAEQTIVKVMPWLDDAERGEAIELLVALRAPL